MHIILNYISLYFADCDGKLQVTSPTGDTEEFVISLDQILAFFTGVPEEPPMGFDPKPSLLFQNKSKFPIANTCSNQLHLPLEEVAYDVFKYNITFGIVNTAGFGQI